jgi:hypothetical protein
VPCRSNRRTSRRVVHLTCQASGRRQLAGTWFRCSHCRQTVGEDGIQTQPTVWRQWLRRARLPSHHRPTRRSARHAISRNLTALPRWQVETLAAAEHKQSITLLPAVTCHHAPGTGTGLAFVVAHPNLRGLPDSIGSRAGFLTETTQGCAQAKFDLDSQPVI